MNSPLVIGYKGEIGSFILNGLLRVMPKALDIWCVDVNETEEEVKERIAKSDTIFLCVPLRITLGWILRYKDLLKGKTIIEQCSLKEWIYEESRSCDLDIRSMHILFRPSQTPDKADRRLGLFKGQFNDEMIEKLLAITDSYLVTYGDEKEHDKEMAIQQALTHRTLLLLGATLKGCNGSTYISKKVIELAERIGKGNVDLYKMIQENKHLEEHLERMERGLREFDIENYMVG